MDFLLGWLMVSSTVTFGDYGVSSRRGRVCRGAYSVAKRPGFIMSNFQSVSG